MSFGESSGSDNQFKKFVSQNEIDKERQARQEEWDKVRKPDDPEEAPEEKHDPRSLFEQLQANKGQADEEFEERMRLGNQVHSLDEGETDFLNFVSQKKVEITKKREQENEEMVQEVREAMVNKVVDKTSTKSDAKKAPKATPMGSSQSRSQTSLLAGAIKRKTSEKEEVSPKKHKPVTSASCNLINIRDATPSATNEAATVCSPSEVSQVVGILPGIGTYTDSDSEDTSGSDDCDINTDLFPKLVKCQQAAQGQCGHAH